MIGEKIKTNAENIVGGIQKVGKRNLVICVMVLLVAASVCINWALYSGAQTPPSDDPAGALDGNTEQTGTNDENDNVASYFASVQISRQQARDEALEVLQLVIDSDSAVESAKAEAIADVSRIADEIASEANIETLVKAKGFEECVAVIGEDSVSVVVCAENLQATEVAQIMSIVFETTGVSPEKVSVVQK